MADEILSEEWRSIEGWPYEVSNLGRVRRAEDAINGLGHVHVRRGAQKRDHVNGRGYREVVLYSGGRGTHFKIARLVCRAFHGEPPSPVHEVAHCDGNRTNDVPANLRWATRSENHADKIIHGTAQRGENGAATVLSEGDVRAIRVALQAGEMQTMIAGRFGVDACTINDIKAGRSWAWLK